MRGIENCGDALVTRSPVILLVMLVCKENLFWSRITKIFKIKYTRISIFYFQSNYSSILDTYYTYFLFYL
jgi:hypothetical protein